MPTRRLMGTATSSSVPDNGGDHSGGGGGGTYVDDVFSTYLYKADGTVTPIVNGIDLAGEGGMVWMKSRTGNLSHHVFDTERGVRESDGAGYALYTDGTQAQGPSNVFKGFNSDGFTSGALNASSWGDMASWTFRKAPKFFDVVTYRGNNSTPVTVPHNLGVEPGMIIIKSSDTAGDWYVYHKGFTFPNWCALNSTDAQGTAKGAGLTAPPTAESFTVSNGSGVVGADQEYVAYVFAHDDSDESMIKCGSFDTNSSGDATVDLGFEPQFVITKLSVGSQGGWFTFDDMRGIGSSNSTSGSNAKILFANAPDAEKIDNSRFINVHSNGFSARMAGNCQFVYMAIRRPNKPAEEFDPEELFAAVENTYGSTDPSFKTGFPVDMSISDGVSMGYDKDIAARLTGPRRLETNTNNAEGGQPAHQWDYMDGEMKNTNGADFGWLWRRAPGFFDVVCYEGDNSASRDIHHNLAATPEFIITKTRNNPASWICYHSAIGNEKYISLNSVNAESTASSGWWNNTTPTDSVFTVGQNPNQSGNTYIAYLFASVPGISKVGSYTGNGSEVEVDCGFTAGARWLLVKRADSTGDWYFTCNPNNFKTLAKLNTTDAPSNYMSTNNDVPAGFRVTSTSGDLCVDGAEYIFYAIA